MHSLFDWKDSSIITIKDKALITSPTLTQSNSKNKAAYNRLVNRFGGVLYRYAYWNVHDVERASGLTQSTFAALWTHFGEFNAGKNAKVRIFGLMYWDLANRATETKTDSKSTPASAAEKTICERQKHGDSSHFDISTKVLSAQQLQLLGLQLLGGFSEAEIGLISGLPQATVRSEITAAKLRLIKTK